MGQSIRHPFRSWRNLVNAGRWRKRRSHPTREQFLVEQALKAIGLRYKTWVTYINPYYRGWKGEQDDALQILNFCVWTGKKMVVLLFTHNRHQNQKQAQEAKQRLLDEKNIPWLILSRKETSQVYEHIIRTFLRKEEG